MAAAPSGDGGVTALDALILGLVQGLTEFLPISSSGHLVLAEKILGFQRVGLAFEIWLHVATLAAVATILRKDLWLAARSILPRAPEAVRGPGRRLILHLVVGTLPAVAVGFSLQNLIEKSFGSLLEVGVEFLITAVILLATRWIPERSASLTVVKSLVIGTAQALAIFPAISRSGCTLAAGLAVGLPGSEAARFSFLLSIPAILGGVVLEAHHLIELGNSSPVPLLVGFAASAATGYWSVRIVWRVMQQRRLALFAPYCAVVGILTVLWATLGPR